jgi:tRNA nucleotidyltransferase (CCA-adding enzyme)
MADYAYLLENRLSLNQRNALEKVRDVARDHGMTVFLSGGAIRDLSTGFPVRDLDFTVQGNALKLKKSLEKAGASLWGGHEPSRTLFFWFHGTRIEVASARREEYPKPGKPVYHWAPILEDLRRRDFTANAMAVSLNEGSYGLLLDPLNGIADIEARTLRLISPYGFIEDPSRLLRAVRLSARTGWEMDERTKGRYENAKEEDTISAIPSFLRGYELEEIVHEEDALKVLKALEAEGWMKQIFPAWTSSKADAKGLETLHRTLLQLLMQGIHPDLSAAHMELLIAKLSPKDRSALKRLFPQQGFVKHWERLEHDTKAFQKELLDKKNAAPSATWKLLTSYAPEPVLWLAYTSKNSQVQTKFKNFATVWPEARQKIPTALMLEMRITPDLPGYQALVEEIFFALMDGKLVTEEEMRAFLEPHSPPAPPPPASIRRTRAKRVKVVEEEEDHDAIDLHAGDLDEEALSDEEHEEIEDESDIPLAPVKKAAKTPIAKDKAAKTLAALKSAHSEKSAPPVKAVAAENPAHGPKPSPQPKASAAAKPAKHVAPPAKKAVPAKVAAISKGHAPQKPAAKPAKKTVAKAAKKPAKPVSKVVKKPAAKPAKKPLAKLAKKPVAKKPAKPVKKKR